MDESDSRGVRLPWSVTAKRLLEAIPGIASAEVEGTREWVSEVRIWYEPTWPVDQLLAEVDERLIADGARLAATRFHATVAQPDRRAARRARPEPTPVVPSAPVPPTDAPLRLIGHKVVEAEDGVVGVQIWIEWKGRTFSGAALGPAALAGSLRTAALATLRALHSCLQVLYDGPAQPGLVLESAVQVAIGDAPVVVVALTASERARARQLTGAWPDEGDAVLAVSQATLHATARTITRWLNEESRAEGVLAAANGAGAHGAMERRVALVDYEVEESPSGDLDVGVRLAGFGEAVDRRRNGRDDEQARVQLGVSATLDAVHELMMLGGRGQRTVGDLRVAGARRVRTGDHDLVVVLAEASMDGRRVPLAGATSADGGVERASITATLQATNPLVAERVLALAPVGATN